MVEDITAICRRIRERLIEMHSISRASHIGSAYSCVEILAALYFSVLRLYPEDPRHPDRDRFVLSKGHAASTLYAALALKGLIQEETLKGFHLAEGTLPGHPDRLTVPFVEASTGSLGHGLPICVGIAYALKLRGSNSRTYVLMSDGEIQEGSVWEAANNASRLELENLTAIIDANRLQAFERTDRIMPIKSFRPKWESFGWCVEEVDGHNLEELVEILSSVPVKKSRPTILIAHTVKGKGISEFEDSLEWHYKSPDPLKTEEYMRELHEKRIC